MLGGLHGRKRNGEEIDESEGRRGPRFTVHGPWLGGRGAGRG